MVTGLIETVEHSIEYKEVEDSAKKSVKVDIEYILEKLASGEVVAIFEHNGRQQNEHYHIFDKPLRVTITVLKKVTEVKNE